MAGGASRYDRGDHVRPYLLAYERQVAQQARQRRQQALRQRQVLLAVRGVDLASLVAQGVEVAA